MTRSPADYTPPERLMLAIYNICPDCHGAWEELDRRRAAGELYRPSTATIPWPSYGHAH